MTPPPAQVEEERNEEVEVMDDSEFGPLLITKLEVRDELLGCCLLMCIISLLTFMLIYALSLLIRNMVLAL